jgi:hypothetical protein
MGIATPGRIIEELGPMRAKKAAKANQAVEAVPPIRLTAPWRIKTLRVLPGFRLQVTFVDKTAGEVDMSQLLSSPKSDGTFFEPLRNPVEFAKAELVLGAVEWSNGANIDPDWMHEEVRKHGRWVVPA